MPPCQAEAARGEFGRPQSLQVEQVFLLLFAWSGNMLKRPREIGVSIILHQEGVLMPVCNASGPPWTLALVPSGFLRGFLLCVRQVITCSPFLPLFSSSCTSTPGIHGTLRDSSRVDVCTSWSDDWLRWESRPVAMSYLYTADYLRAPLLAARDISPGDSGTKNG